MEVNAISLIIILPKDSSIIYILIIFNFYYIFKFFNKILTYQIIFIINNKMNSFICKYNYHNYQFSYLFN
jgi:hypothetical protein